MPSANPGESSSAGRAAFLTTRWSLVVAAARPDEPRSRAALAELCAAYWQPLYTYVRRRGHDRESARDLTQGFFVRLLEKNSVGGADRDRGRFRAWLLGAMKHFLANEWDRENAQKRGGGRAPLSLDFQSADEAFKLEPAVTESPESAYERDWALAVLERAFAALETTYVSRGRAELFAALRDTLTSSGGESYAAIAARLGSSEGAIKVAAHRLRQAFRESLRAEIAETVDESADLDGEIRHLIAALGGRLP